MSTTTDRMTSPPADFRSLDAYETWLQARALQRELSPYELLGLKPLETNTTKIKAAIDRQSVAAAGHASTAAPELQAMFQKEFDQAVATLQNSERKSLLDAALRRSGVGAAEREVEAGGEAAPAASAAGTIACGACRHPNAPDRKFCSSCGASLWDVCPKCRAARLASERFCGQCGTDVDQFLRTQSEHLDGQIALARKLQAQAQFVDARRIVREVARVEDRKFEAQAQLAARLIEEFTVDQREQEAAVEKAVELATQLIAGHAYDSALAALKDVPVALETADVKRLRGEAAARQQEAERILTQIREGLEKKQTLPLLSLIERFLTLKPDHAQARKLSVQIAEQIFAKARKAVRDADWDGALQLLRSMPEYATTDEMRKLVEDCEERCWLAAEVRRSSILHPSLPAVADRLVELNPGREEFTTLGKKIRDRLAAGPQSPWQGAPDWASPPQRSSVGVPVEWYAGFQRIVSAPDLNWPVPRAARSRFCVAAGLALQAIGKTALDLNLVVEAKGSVFSRLASGLRRKAPLVGWGLDLSNSSLKAVRLRWDEAAGKAVIDACELIEFESAVDGARDGAGSMAAVEALRQLLGKHVLAGARIAVNLPPMQCLARFLVVPGVAAKKLDDLVKYEARQQIPIPLEDLAWEYATLGDGRDAKGEDAERPLRILLLAAKQTSVDQRKSLFENGGVKPDLMQSDAVALHNFLQFDRLDPPNDSAAPTAAPTVAIVDVGAESTSFIVSGDGFVWFRTFIAAADDFTKALVREFKLTRKQAEEAKRHPHRVRKMAKLAECWEPLYSQLRNEARRSLEQWKSLDASHPPTRLLCVGGGVQTYGLVEALRFERG